MTLCRNQFSRSLQRQGGLRHYLRGASDYALDFGGFATSVAVTKGIMASQKIAKRAAFVVTTIAAAGLSYQLLLKIPWVSSTNLAEQVGLLVASGVAVRKGYRKGNEKLDEYLEYRRYLRKIKLEEQLRRQALSRN